MAPKKNAPLPSSFPNNLPLSRDRGYEVEPHVYPSTRKPPWRKRAYQRRKHAGSAYPTDSRKVFPRPAAATGVNRVAIRDSTHQHEHGLTVAAGGDGMDVDVDMTAFSSAATTDLTSVFTFNATRTPPAHTDVNSFVRHEHWACEHEYFPDADNAHEELHIAADPVCDADGSGVKKLLVFHPRWCYPCRHLRNMTLTAYLEKRLATMVPRVPTPSDEEQVHLLKERAYLKGVVRGWIRAMAEPLTEHKDIFFVDDAGDERDLHEVMMGLSISSSAGPTDLCEELLMKMREQNVEYGEFEHDFDVAFMETEEEEHGVEDGRAMQSALEKTACEEQDGVKRKQLLDAALL